MAEKQNSSTLHAWDQLDWIWHALAYGLLILHAFIARGNDMRNGSISTILGFTALLAFWYAPFVVRPRATWSMDAPRTLTYFVPGWILWGVLVYLHPAALMLAGVFFPIMFSRLPIRWSIISVSIVTLGLLLVTITVLNPSEETLPTLILTAGLVLISAIAIALFINSLVKQSQDRQRLVEELSQTRASLLKIEREAGVLGERQRMAREIHDTLAQDFINVIMHLTAAKLKDASAQQVHIQQAEQTAREGLDEARRIVWALRPEQLEHFSLAESLEQLAARFSVENPVSISTSITGTPRPLGPEKEAGLLRVAQEALNNIKKHARARSVNMTLSYMSDLIALDVVDDGIGFDSGVEQRGFGLKSMRERVDELSGTLTIESGNNKGTAIAISLPAEDA